MNKKQRTLGELEIRRQVCLKILQVLKADVDPAEPRLPGAIEFYQNQLGVLDQEIAMITGKPPAIVIGLKTATLTGKVPRQGG